MRKSLIPILLLSAFIPALASAAPVQLVQGAAVLGDNAPVIKIFREGLPPAAVGEGDILFIFTEKGDPVTEVPVKDVFSDEIYSQPLDEELVIRLRGENTILIFANVPEYGEFLKAYLNGREEAFRDFLRRHPASLLEGEARRVADGIVYRPYKLKGTAEALEEFLRLHPDSSWKEAAELRRDQLQFDPVSQADLIDQYRLFTVRYPRNRFVGQALTRVQQLRDAHPRVVLPRLLDDPQAFMGKKLRFSGYIHSLLPIFLQGGAVGRKTERFHSPRAADDYLNVQFDDGGPYILWRGFLRRDLVTLVDFVETGDREEPWTVFGEVFSTDANAPWLEITDMVPGRE